MGRGGLDFVKQLSNPNIQANVVIQICDSFIVALRFQFFDICLVVQRIVGRGPRELIADIFHVVTAVSRLPVFLQNVLTRVTDSEGNSSRDIAAAHSLQRAAIGTVFHVMHQKICCNLFDVVIGAEQRCSAHCLIRQQHMALHMDQAVRLITAVMLQYRRGDCGIKRICLWLRPVPDTESVQISDGRSADIQGRYDVLLRTICIMDNDILTVQTTEEVFVILILVNLFNRCVIGEIGIIGGIDDLFDVIGQHILPENLNTFVFKYQLPSG